MSKHQSSRDSLLYELSHRFKSEGIFKKSENQNKKTKNAIWIDTSISSIEKSLIVSPEELIENPDFEILLEKYDAWVEPQGQGGFFVFIKHKDNDTIKDEEKFNLIFKDKLKSFKRSGRPSNDLWEMPQEPKRNKY